MIMHTEIIRGATRRFFPAAIIGAVVMSLLFGAPEFAAVMWVRILVGSLAAAVLATLGFVGTMILTRRFLRTDAEVAGRKSALAGFVAAGASYALLAFSPSFLVMTVSLFRLSPFYMGRTIAIPILGGFVTTFALYFPWLSRTPDVTSPANRSADLLTGAARFMLRRRSTHSVRHEGP
jgi:hypothetical protein